MESGTPVSWEDRKEGDLMFFQNKVGTIVHVGILLEGDKILHASGRVRIDALVDKNIWNAELNETTHEYHSVQRYLTF
jgi:cell wall-associated NlpC family hydrolase